MTLFWLDVCLWDIHFRIHSIFATSMFKAANSTWSWFDQTHVIPDVFQWCLSVIVDASHDQDDDQESSQHCNVMRHIHKDRTLLNILQTKDIWCRTTCYLISFISEKWESWSSYCYCCSSLESWGDSFWIVSQLKRCFVNGTVMLQQWVGHPFLLE